MSTIWVVLFVIFIDVSVSCLDVKNVGVCVIGGGFNVVFRGAFCM